LFTGAGLYHQASKDRDLVKRLSAGTPTDWIERNIYSAHSKLGVTAMALIDLAVFGWWGLAVWTVQMLWIPFWAAGVINGLGHWSGYRNTTTPDTSTNLIPWAVWIGGEELHNNHHADGANPKFSKKWWEFDLGWFYIRLLSLFGLAKLRTN
jgi:stearoyl-CoA desaturase (delta-9 desaturase)